MNPYETHFNFGIQAKIALRGGRVRSIARDGVEERSSGPAYGS
jgi:hypothetical protein